MKILNRSQFMELPSGVLYQKYEPQCFGELAIKWDSLTTDFVSVDVSATSFVAQCSNNWAELIDGAQYEGKSVAIDFDCASRDGCFDQDQLFAVWELADVKHLMATLGGLIDKYPNVA